MPRLSEISEDECWELLGGSELARIAWNGGSGPTILPVNYTADGRSIWLRTGAHSSMTHEIDASPVAVLVDSIDAVTHEGWSVQLRGTVRAEYRAENVPEHVRELETWAEGVRPIWLHLVPDDVNGRRIGG